MECLHLLIEKSCDLNHKDICGQTPAYKATKYNQIECLRVLCDENCNIELANNNGLRPIDIAYRNESSLNDAGDDTEKVKECISILCSANRIIQG